MSFQKFQVEDLALSSDEELRVLFTKEEGRIRMAHLTPAEYRLVILLISEQKAVSDTTLLQAQPTLDRKSLERTIRRLRAKLQKLQLSVKRVARYGYILLSEKTYKDGVI